MTNTDAPHPRLIELRVQNYQCIKAVNIRPDGNVVMITGANDVGKTSVLRAIWTLLAGKAATPVEVIRLGEEACKLYGDFGTMKVTRTFTRTESGEITMSVKVTDADGNRITTKQESYLQAMLGAYAFDPLAFAKADPRKQFDLLKGFVTDFDFEAHAEERKKTFEKRTEVNRRAAEAQAAANKIELPPGSCPKAVDVSAVLAKINEAAAHNASIETLKSRKAALVSEASRHADDFRRHKDRAEQLRKEAEEEDRRAELARAASGQALQTAEAVAIPDPIDTADLQAQIDQAETTRRIREKHQARTKHLDDAEALEAEAKALTKKIEDLDAAKEQAVMSAALPVPGLSFGDNCILWNGVPFEQAATSKKIRVSAAIGMALNPELRIMTIDEGSELDSAALAVLEELAEAADFQVFIAKVDETGEVGFVIEDGSLKAEG